MKVMLLIAHGSRKAEANDEIGRLAQRVQALAGNDYGAVVAAFLEQEPDFTVAMMEDWAFQNRTYLERWIEDLRTAGLP